MGEFLKSTYNSREHRRDSGALLVQTTCRLFAYTGYVDWAMGENEQATKSGPRTVRCFQYSTVFSVSFVSRPALVVGGQRGKIEGDSRGSGRGRGFVGARRIRRCHLEDFLEEVRKCFRPLLQAAPSENRMLGVF